MTDKNKEVVVEVFKGQGGHSIAVSHKHDGYGHRFCGPKVTFSKLITSFNIDLEELIREARAHSVKKEIEKKQ